MNSVFLQGGLAAGIGRAADAIDRATLIVMFFLILISAILVIIGIRNRRKGYRVLLGVVCGLFLFPVVLCYQQEVQLYKSGTLLLVICIIGLVFAFRKNR